MVEAAVGRGVPVAHGRGGPAEVQRVVLAQGGVVDRPVHGRRQGDGQAPVAEPELGVVASINRKVFA